MKGFWGLFYTAFLGAANDNFFKNAFVMLIAFKGMQVWGLDHKSVVALAGGVFILPYFLFSGIAGEIADKWERDYLIRLIKFWELFIMAAASLCFFLEAYDWLMLVLFCMGTQSTFFGPVKYSSIYDLSTNQSFVKYNAFMELATFIGILLGTLGGGLAAGANSYSLISAGILCMAIVGIFTSFKIPKLKSLSPNLELNLNPIPPSVRILKSCFKNNDIFWTIIASSWFWFLGASLLALIPILAKDILKADETVATAFLVCFTVGIGIGSLISERLSFGRVELALTPLSGLVASFFLIDIGLVTNGIVTTHDGLSSFSQYFQTPGSTRVMIDMLLLTIFCGIFIVPLNAWLQIAGGESMRSRVIAGNNIINALAMVFSAVFLMILHGMNLSTPKIFIVLGVMSFSCSIILCMCYPYFVLRIWAWFHSRWNGKVDVMQDGPNEYTGHAYLCRLEKPQNIAYVIACAQNPSLIIYDRKLVQSSYLRHILNKNGAQGIEDWNNLKEMRALIDKAEANQKQLICFFHSESDKQLVNNYFVENDLMLFHISMEEIGMVKRFGLLPLWKVKHTQLNFDS